MWFSITAILVVSTEVSIYVGRKKSIDLERRLSCGSNTLIKPTESGIAQRPLPKPLPSSGQFSRLVNLETRKPELNKAN